MTQSVNHNVTHVLSNHCDAYAKKMTDAEFQQWRLHDHKCEKNHNGSAGAMEPVGTQVIFRRSQALQVYDIRYTGFLGDGDSKAYASVRDANPPIYIHEEAVDIL